MTQSAARQWPALPEATPQSLALWARQITQLLQGGVLAQSADLTDVVVEADIANMVEAAADLTDNALVLGDGGSRGVKTSTATYSGDLDSLAGSVVKIDARRITTGATNTPPGAAVNGSHVTTYVWDSNAARQVYYQQNSTNVWARAKASGSWGAWHRLASVSPTSLAQGDVLYYDGTNFVRLAPGTAGQFLQTLGAGANPAWASGLNVGTPVATTSGDTADFTGISNARLVKIIFSGVSLSGNNQDVLVQIGDSGGIETTGYTSQSGASVGTGVGTSNSITGFVIRLQDLNRAFSGIMTLARFDSSSHLWIASLAGEHGAGAVFGGGSKTLSAALDRVRVTNTNTGTVDLDAGSFNVMWQ